LARKEDETKMAGRKRHQASHPPKPSTDRKRGLAAGILSGVNERNLWKELLESEELRLRLHALKYLTDRRDGRPPQAPSLKGSGGVTVKLVDDLKD